jgi:hypothetical protein
VIILYVFNFAKSGKNIDLAFYKYFSGSQLSSFMEALEGELPQIIGDFSILNFTESFYLIRLVLKL